MQYCSNLARNNEENENQNEVIGLGIEMEEFGDKFVSDEEYAETLKEMAKAFKEELYN